MSNPVKNAEVEDVLSSVRRLVSSDTRPLSRGTDEMRSEDDTTQSGVDRLVLTPALRVAELQDALGADEVDEADPLEGTVYVEEEPESDENALIADYASDTQRVVDEDGPEEGDIEETGVTAEVTDMEVSSFFARGEAEPSWSGPSTEIDPEELRFLFRARKRSVPVTEAVGDEVSETEMPDAQGSLRIDPVEVDVGEESKPVPLLLTDPTPSAAMRDEQNELDPITEPEIAQSSVNPDTTVSLNELTAKIAAVEAIIAETHDQWDPDDAGVDDYAGSPASSQDWDDSVNLDASVSPLDDDSTEITSETPESVQEMEKQVLEPETWVIPPDAKVNQPDQGTSEDQKESYTEDNPHLADAEPAAVERQDEMSNDVETTGPDKNLDNEAPYILDEMVLDEEALREMIAEIVRQELSGSMGERITHNVRKLVRRELQRALAAEELQ